MNAQVYRTLVLDRADSSAVAVVSLGYSSHVARDRYSDLTILLVAAASLAAEMSSTDIVESAQAAKLHCSFTALLDEATSPYFDRASASYPAWSAPIVIPSTEEGSDA